jgi:hypothetical protein
MSIGRLTSRRNSALVRAADFRNARPSRRDRLVAIRNAGVELYRRAGFRIGILRHQRRSIRDEERIFAGRDGLRR